MTKILISIPCYNEEESVLECIESVTLQKASLDKFEVDILVVDDGSIDNTSNLLKSYDKLIIINSVINHGLSEVFNSIMTYTTINNYDYVLIFDSDNQYPSEDIPLLINNAYNKNSDIEVGFRTFKEIDHFSITKKFLQIFGSKVVSKMTKLKIKDATSGFRVYSKRAAHILFSNNSFTYTIETLFQAASEKLIVGSTKIGNIKETRESRLFNSNFDYVKKSFSIIVKSFFLYKIKAAIFWITALFLTPGIILLSRFFLPYIINGSNPGNVQSLIVGTGYITILIVLLLYILLRINNFKNHTEIRKLIYKAKHT